MKNYPFLLLLSIILLNACKKDDAPKADFSKEAGEEKFIGRYSLVGKEKNGDALLNDLVIDKSRESRESYNLRYGGEAFAAKWYDTVDGELVKFEAKSGCEKEKAAWITVNKVAHASTYQVTVYKFKCNGLEAIGSYVRY
jgi:hypothetical protein